MTGLTPSPFTGTTEKNGGTVNGSLLVNGIVEIDGTTDLSNIVVFNDGGYIEYIQYVAQSEILPNQIQVFGAAPSGLGSGHILLTFTDSTGVGYTLSILSTSGETHTLDILDGAVNIVTIQYALETL